MAFARHQTRGRIETDPSGARQIDFAPGMQVGEIVRGALRPVERLHIGHQLDQVARDKARCQPKAAQQLHQQPGRIAAGPRAQLERALGRLHPGLHADQVADVVLQPLVQAHQKIDGSHRLARHLAQPLLDPGRDRQARQVRGEFVALGRVVAERETLGVRLEEEVEGVENRHLGDEVDFDRELGDALREHRPGEPVRLRILLPVEKVLGRSDAHRIRQHPTARMRRRPQPDHLRAECDRPVVGVAAQMIQGDMDRHGYSSLMTCSGPAADVQRLQQLASRHVKPGSGKPRAIEPQNDRRRPADRRAQRYCRPSCRLESD